MKRILLVVLILTSSNYLFSQNYQIINGKFMANHNQTGWQKGLEILRYGAVIGRFEIDPNNILTIGTMSQTGFSLRTGGSNRIHITDNGKVGIGTTDPKYNLSVKGKLSAEANGDYYGAWFGGEARTTTPSINVGSWYNNRGSMFWDAASKKLKFETCNNSNESFQNTLVMYKGMVGIGTSETKGYRLAVNGSISATEIKVEAQTADFVFEEDYPLKSLEEVEQFIITNKHLPDIPSAKQMKQDGVGLAEMNKLLLQKIEEMTLHMIEMKKELRQVQNELIKLKLKE